MRLLDSSSHSSSCLGSTRHSFWETESEFAISQTIRSLSSLSLACSLSLSLTVILFIISGRVNEQTHTQTSETDLHANSEKAPTLFFYKPMNCHPMKNCEWCNQIKMVVKTRALILILALFYSQIERKKKKRKKKIYIYIYIYCGHELTIHSHNVFHIA